MENEKTLNEAKQFLRENINNGVDCPCCGQMVKLYKRKLTSTMVFCLIQFKKHMDRNGNEFHRYISILDQMKLTPSQRSDWQKLVYFKLIEPETTERGNVRSGFYRMTQIGIDFVNHKTRVPEFVNVYDGKVFGFSENKINISKALDQKFNYLELMSK